MKFYNYLIPYKYIFFFFFFIFNGNFKVQAQELDSLIIWSKDYKLKWDDFLEKKTFPIKKSGALSFLEIHNIKTYYKNEVLYYTVIPVFNRNKSATKHYTDCLLEHEQLHFDILELFARKIRKEFQLLDLNNACDISYNEIFNIYNNRFWLFQKNYDLDTNYSLKPKIQQIWKDKISRELQNLETFSIENLYGVKVEN